MDAVEWHQRAKIEMDAGKRAFCGVICPSCVKLVPRVKETRWDIPAEFFCRCGETTTREQDHAAHGIAPAEFSHRLTKVVE